MIRHQLEPPAAESIASTDSWAGRRCTPPESTCILSLEAVDEKIFHYSDVGVGDASTRQDRNLVAKEVYCCPGSAEPRAYFPFRIAVCRAADRLAPVR